MKYLLPLILTLLTTHAIFGNTLRYRLSLRDDPSTSVVIGWEQDGGSNPTVYYGSTDFGQNWASYPMSQTEDRQVTASGMDNRFVRLSGLTPNTAYYFVIKDSDGVSNRFWFKTTPSGNTEPLSVIAGGDSRAYLDSSPRQNANSLVSKLRPDFVMFGGDYTWLGLDLEWGGWMDDWQMTTSADGRMYPVIWERGNHEMSAGIVTDLFDIPGTDEYFAIPVGGDFLRVYTLNTEISVSGNQATWLENDLQTNFDNFDWNIVQYHRSIRPHTTSKADEDLQYNAWAQLFHDYRVQLVVESDAHDVKTTWPIKPSTGPNSDSGFEEDTISGTVYIGEGCWGAPLRTNDWDRSWTRNSASFNSFHWLKITRDTIEIRTIGTDNASSVGSVTDNDRFTPPSGIDIWNPSNGNVVYITNQKYIGRPQVEVTYPFNLQYFGQPQALTLAADAIDTNGTIQYVNFFVNDVQVGQDFTYPYEANFTIPSNGEYVINAWAVDNEGWHNVSENVTVYAGDMTISASIASNEDDAEEYLSDGSVDLTSSDLELCVEEWVWPISDEDQWVGIRFSDIQIPQGATISNAYIQFTADENQSDPAAITIYGQAVDNANTFIDLDFNISSRPQTSASVSWTPVAWNTDDATSNEQTDDITSIVQEIVNRSGWQSGNSMAFLFEGSGTRSAYSRDTDETKAAKLFITFSYTTPTTIQIDEEIEINYSIFPNPTSDQITIKWDNDKQANINILDMNGKTILSKQVSSGNQLKCNFPSGIYFVKISQNNQTHIEKIIIQ